ncbi:hypothetical protein AAFN85_28700 [Mucilaginibacter sp. CAU 1740]|uniref:hypothetical protein n=1 Tax=Mucilaginibacter sp. CAU 1740 TaxID=3140365 RepID=UPI00325B986E
MNQHTRNKIEQFKKLATIQGHETLSHTKVANNDSLSQVIRSKVDAENFMAELELAAKRAGSSK